MRWARNIFIAAFSVAILVILFGENARSGTFLDYLARGSLLIAFLSGLYMGIVAAWNYTLESDE